MRDFTPKKSVITPFRAQVSIVRENIRTAVLEGANFDNICQQADIKPEELENSDGYFSDETNYKVWKAIIKETGNPLVGLRFGTRLEPMALGMLGNLLLCSPTLLEVLHNISRYNTLFSSLMTYTTVLKGNYVIFKYSPISTWELRFPLSVRQSLDMSMSGIISLLSQISGKTVKPVSISLSGIHEHFDEYQQLLPCELKFNTGENSVTFLATDLKEPLLRYDPLSYRFYMDILDQRLKPKSLKEQIESLLAQKFPDSLPSVEMIASAMGTSSRSLQRGLANEGFQYREVLQKTKMDTARKLVNTLGISLKEAATKVGYIDQSNFRKTFKKYESSFANQA